MIIAKIANGILINCAVVSPISVVGQSLKNSTENLRIEYNKTNVQKIIPLFKFFICIMNDNIINIIRFFIDSYI